MKSPSLILPGVPAEVATMSIQRPIHGTQTVTRKLSRQDRVETIIKVPDHDLHTGLGGQGAREAPDSVRLTALMS